MQQTAVCPFGREEVWLLGWISSLQPRNARSPKLKTRPWRPGYQGRKSLSLKSKTNRLLDLEEENITLLRNDGTYSRSYVATSTTAGALHFILIRKS